MGRILREKDTKSLHRERTLNLSFVPFCDIAGNGVDQVIEKEFLKLIKREKLDLDYFFKYVRQGTNHGVVIKADRDLPMEFYDRLFNELADDLNFPKIDSESQGSKDDKAYIPPKTTSNDDR